LEKLKISLTDFDFENRLSSDSYSKPEYNKISESFESLYLWVENSQSCLFSAKKYSEEYLSYVREKRGFVPRVGHDDSFNDLWWSRGSIEENFEQEKKINSKETSFHCRRDLSIELKNSQMISHLSELSQIPFPFILKDLFGFSGRGITFIRNQDELDCLQLSNFPVLCEPLLKRIRDFGVFYCGESRGEVVQNLIDTRGQFKGALMKKSFPEEEELLEQTRPVYDWYRDRFEIEHLQIDCFQYLDGGELMLNALCEVNHRNTMGQVASLLHQELGGQSSAFLIVPRKKLAIFKSQNDRVEHLASLNYSSRFGVLTLSPVDCNFQVFFISEESDRTLQMLITSWWKKLRLNTEEALPREFIINS
jgi:hypothetical protein